MPGGAAAAARYDERDPLIDYQSWNPFEAVAATRFDWTHAYGPIDWPRDGKTLMNVRSDERNYWKVETLDQSSTGHAGSDSRFGLGNNPLLPEPYRPEWETRLPCDDPRPRHGPLPDRRHGAAIEGADR